MKTIRFTKVEDISTHGDSSVIPVGYWAEGIAASLPEVGQPFRFARTARAPRLGEEGKRIEAPGIFTTSAVQSVTPYPEDKNVLQVVTSNSIWNLQEISD